MKWHLSYRADPRANVVAKRHYTCQSPDSPQFVTPGRCMVLLTEKADALWITSYPYAEYVKHEWAGAWVCSCFRNENQYNRKNKSGHLSSQLILEAIAATRWFSLHQPKWEGIIPTLGMITFVDPTKVRTKEVFGQCYLSAGFEVVGETKQDHLIALQLKPEKMPEPHMPLGRLAKQMLLKSQVEQLILMR